MRPRTGISLSLGFFLLTALAGDRARAQAAPRKLALLVAVQDYKSPAPPSLPGVRKVRAAWADLTSGLDTTRLRRLLLSPKFGFKNEDVLVLSDLKAFRGASGANAAAAAVPDPRFRGSTRQGIIDAFRAHLGQARPGDVVLFHYSGHGHQIANQGQGEAGYDAADREADGYDEAFVPYDYVGTNAGDAAAYLRDDDLGRLLRELRDEKMRGRGSINLLIDSCHSATVSRGSRTTRGRGADESSYPPGMLEESGNAEDLGKGYVLMSACRSNESAYEYEPNPGTPLGGAFTYHLCELLQNTRKDVTYRELFERVQAFIHAQVGLQQTPVVEGESTVLNSAIFGGQLQSIPVFTRVKKVNAEDKTAVLDAGALMGVTKGSVYALYREDGDAVERKRPLAELEITEAPEIYQSVGRLKSIRAMPSVSQPAALVSRTYGDDLLKVWVDRVPELATALKGLAGAPGQAPLELVAASPTDGKKPPAFDFRVTSEPNPAELKAAGLTAGPNHLYLTRSDNTVVMQVPRAAAAAPIRAALLRHWKLRALSALGAEEPNPDLEVKLTVVPLDVPVGSDGRPSFSGATLRATQQADPSGRLLLREGDYFRVELEYVGRAREVFATVLNLASDGTIEPIFPHPNDRVRVDNRLGKARSKVRTGVFRVAKPLGLDTYRVLVTTQDVDFMSLADSSKALELGPSIAKGARGATGQLARLIEAVTTGTRGATAVSVTERDWGMSSVVVRTAPK